MTGPRLKREVELLFDVIKDRCTQDELVIICPVPGCHDASGNRSVNLKSGATNCWRCNKASKSFVKFCRSLGMQIDETGHVDPDIGEAEKLMEEFDKVVYGTVVPIRSTCKLPKGFTPIRDMPKSVYSQMIGEMAVKKNLTWDDLADAHCGFTRDDFRWEPFAIFPVFEWENVVYYQGRLYHSEPGEKTKKFPSNKETPLGSRYWIYNIDAARKRQAEHIIVVESILNVISLEKKIAKERCPEVVPVCVFKHNISRAQLAKILSVRTVKELCFMWDADSTSHALECAERMANQKHASVAEIPAVISKTQDANDDVDTAWNCFLKRRRVTRPLDALESLAAEL
jgi:hypothetical protein